MRVLLIFGGASPEHDVSIRSAKSVYSGLTKEHEVQLCYITKNGNWKYTRSIDQLHKVKDLKYDIPSKTWITDDEKFKVDVAFIIVHGVGGEDGILQSKLDKWGVKYVGTPSKESAICFDKVKTKELLRENFIPVVEEYIYREGEEVPSVKRLFETVGDVPYFVKPARSGSSVGVSKITNDTELLEAIKTALKYDDKILIERGVSSPRELEVAVIEKQPGSFEASVVGEIVNDAGFYSYDSKYSSSSTAKTVTQPKDLARKITNQARKTAIQANSILGCRGLVRVDFLYDTVRDILYLNELNTLPGFTSISMYPMLWETSGMSLSKQLDTMVKVAVNSKSIN